MPHAPNVRRWLAALSLVAACGKPPAPPAAAPTQVAHPAWAERANIYEVNIRQYTPEGTFNAFRKHLPRLRAMGVDVLWLMPVQPIGVKNRKGALGSYYSVGDYRGINPEFGTREDLQALIADAHARGFKVVLDWVPNHTAFDHPWITAHPDYYVHDAKGAIINARDNENHDTDWTDVAELDYANPRLRQAMIGEMRWWVDSMALDGFRNDVAGGVPLDFWTEARAALQTSRPDLFFLAEAEGPAFHASFDMTYAWELHHLLNAVAQGKKGTGEIAAYLDRQGRDYPADAYRMAFTSNHDENSWNGTEFERMGANHQAAFVLCATLPNTMPLIYSGQEVSLSKRLRFFQRDTIPWNGPSLAPFYTTLLGLKHANPALANGAAGGAVTVFPAAGDRTFAFARTKGPNAVVVAVNFGEAPATVAYKGFGAPGRYADAFGKDSVSLAAEGTITVPAHGWRVLAK